MQHLPPGDCPRAAQLGRALLPPPHPLERARPWRSLRRVRTAGALHEGAARLLSVAALTRSFRPIPNSASRSLVTMVTDIDRGAVAGALGGDHVRRGRVSETHICRASTPRMLDSCRSAGAPLPECRSRTG